MLILHVHIDGENFVHGIFNRLSETENEGKLFLLSQIFQANLFKCDNIFKKVKMKKLLEKLF